MESSKLVPLPRSRTAVVDFSPPPLDTMYVDYIGASL